MKEENYKKVFIEDEEIERDERWIDVHDDDVMREHGLWRPYNQSPRDPSVWRKTPNERRIFKQVMYSMGKIEGHCPSSHKKAPLVRAKLIVQLKKNKVFPKTTYSFMCFNTAINDILSRFTTTNPKTGYNETLVAKYSYNGTPYEPHECPWINQ